MSDNGPRLRDIAVLLLFAVLLRLAEMFERDDVPGWWRDDARLRVHDGHSCGWRHEIDEDALIRREAHE